MPVAGIDQACAGIRNTGHSGIGDDCYPLPSCEPLDQLLCALGFVVLVETDERNGDAMVVEQASRMAGVFAGNDVRSGEFRESTLRNISEVPDRRGDDYKHAGGRLGYGRR